VRKREGRKEGRGTDTPMDGKEGMNEGGRKRELKRGKRHPIRVEDAHCIKTWNKDR
jgi:hypothetical protein